MKILTEIKNITRLEDYKSCDSIIVNTKYSISPNPIYENEDLLKIYEWTKSNNKQLIFRIDKLFMEDEVNEVYGFLDFVINRYPDCYFIYNDMAIFYYFKKINKLNSLYYYAQTYLCNRDDLQYFTSLGINVLMSNELTLEDLYINEGNNVGVLAYGYFNIFYSKRELLSLYKDYLKSLNIEIDLKKHHLYDLKEELREDLYKIYEFEDSCVIFSSFKMFLYKELNELKIDFVYISNYFIDDDENKFILDLYSDAINNGNYKDVEIENTFSSFLYKKPNILGGDK